MDIFFYLLGMAFILVFLMIAIRRPWAYILLSLLLIADLALWGYVGYMNYKYTWTESLHSISVEFRGKYRDIETAINRNPSDENIQRLKDWNQEVKDMQDEFRIWSLRSYMDWREINPIQLSYQDISDLKSGKLILDDFELVAPLE